MEENFEETLESWGNRLKYAREKRKLTQKQLSELTGTDRSYISHIEHGTINYKIKTLLKILDQLNIAPEDFLKKPIRKKLDKHKRR